MTFPGDLPRAHRGVFPFDDAARDAIDSRRALADARRYAREHRAQLEAEWEALPDGRPWTLDDHIAGRKLP